MGTPENQCIDLCMYKRINESGDGVPIVKLEDNVKLYCHSVDAAMNILHYKQCDYVISSRIQVCFNYHTVYI